MDRIMMKIDDFLGMQRSLSNNIGLLRIQKERAESLNLGFWRGPGSEQFSGSLKAWENQLQDLMDNFENFYRRIEYETEEWTTTDLKYDYEGEEIDTFEELKQLFWDVLSGDLQPGDLLMTIDIKDILGSNLPWDWRYPPEKTSVWVQVGNEWVEFDATGPDWDADLKIDLERKTAYLDGSWNAGSLDILASLGDGYVAGWSYSFLSITGSAGVVDGTPLAGAGAFLATGEAFIGRNISEYDFTGYHVGLNVLGFSLQPGTTAEPIEVGVSPKGVSAGIAPFFEFEIGRDLDKPRDPTPPDRVP
jgi:hypothetical protein